MTLTIYLARLLHYVTCNDADKSTKDTNDPFTLTSVPLTPINKRDVIYPQYIKHGALVVDDKNGVIVDYGESVTILDTYNAQESNKLNKN